jgi:hypothetical protein
LIELGPLRHPSEMQQDIQFVRVSQEVTKRFYNLSAVHCLRRGIARYSFRRKNLLATCKVDGCSLASKLPVRRWPWRRFRRVPSLRTASAHQYAHDELQAQRRAIRTAKDRFSIEGSVGDGTLVIPHRRSANAQTMCVFAVHGGARKRPGRPAAHHDLRR